MLAPSDNLLNTTIFWRKGWNLSLNTFVVPWEKYLLQSRASLYFKFCYKACVNLEENISINKETIFDKNIFLLVGLEDWFVCECLLSSPAKGADWLPLAGAGALVTHSATDWSCSLSLHSTVSCSELQLSLAAVLRNSSLRLSSALHHSHTDDNTNTLGTTRLILSSTIVQ